MALTEDDIQEFRSLFIAEFGGDISLQDARAMASRVMHLYTRLALTLPSEGKGAGLAKTRKICIVSMNGHGPPEEARSLSRSVRPFKT